MSKTIKVSDEDFVRIRNAAAAEGLPMGAWVVAHLPLETKPAVVPSAGGRPAKTMADLLAGRVGVIGGGAESRLAEAHGEVFADMLEGQHRAGRL